MTYPRYFRTLEKVKGIGAIERMELEEVCRKFPFRANEYYLSLIDWDDPDDPIRHIIIPDRRELEAGGELDASNERLYTKVPGLEHKYTHIAVLLVSDVCGSFCRFCFRKRLFMKHGNEVERDVTEAIRYIRAHTELDNVLITGGDPLLLSTGRLETIIRSLREIDHIRIIRIGSKVPAFNPYRILNDPALLGMLSRYSLPDRRIYLIAHFNHPGELTDAAIKALDLVLKTGTVIMNQTPLIRGVNDSPEVLGDLFNRLTYIGVRPYYVFQCRPTTGNRHLAVPVEEAFEIHERAKMKCAGLGKGARFVMSHTKGKVEVLALTESTIVFKFHRSANWAGKARISICKRNPDAYWYDDYTEVVEEYIPGNPFLDEYKGPGLTTHDENLSRDTWQNTGKKP